jgi:hypothetical protein
VNTRAEHVIPDAWALLFNASLNGVSTVREMNPHHCDLNVTSARFTSFQGAARGHNSKLNIGSTDRKFTSVVQQGIHYMAETRWSLPQKT